MISKFYGFRSLDVQSLTLATMGREKLLQSRTKYGNAIVFVLTCHSDTKIAVFKGRLPKSLVVLFFRLS